MAYTAPTVAYSTAIDGTYTALTGVQSITINRGRQRFQDPIPNTVAVIELIPANSYATPLAIGQYLDVRTSNSATAPSWFVGCISDVDRVYDVPYNAGTGAAPGDRIYLTVQGAVGATGQAGNANMAFPLGSDAADSAQAAFSFAGVGIYGYSFGNMPGSNVPVVVPASNILTVGLLDMANLSARSGNYAFDDMDNQRATYTNLSLTYNLLATFNEWQNYRPFTLSDNPGVGEYKYTQIRYLSGAMTAFNSVQVNGYDGSGITPQVSKTAVGITYNGVTFDTYLGSSALMSSLAEYILALNNETAPTPFVVSTSTVAADGCEVLAYMGANPSKTVTSLNAATPLNSQITVKFRGSTVVGQLQGLTASFYPDRANIDFYLSPSLGIPFLLDSATAGVLDTNRLGYP